jgi:hypothetical protein
MTAENKSFAFPYLPLILRWVIPVALGAGILAFLIAKSLKMQITCDESYTVEILTKVPVWDLITYKSSYTNNHILNTLLVKFLFWVFNSFDHSLARVSNILAFVAYFYYCLRFSQKYISDNWVSLMFISVMCCNPYLLDFFALIRGYGISIGLMMGSIYFAARYLLDNYSKGLIISVLMSVFSVYAQFATLHFYLGINLLIALYLIKNYSINKENKKLIYGISVQFMGFLLLALLIYLPIKAIIRDNQIAYYGTDGFWGSTLSSLIKGSLYSETYFKNEQTIPIFKFLTIVLFFLLTAFISYSLGEKSVEKLEKTYPSVFASVLFFSTAFSVIAQFHLLGNQYVVDRTALFFYPLLAMLLPTIPIFFGRFRQGVSTFIAVLFIVFSVNHIKRTNTLTSYREWWYDVHTYEIMDMMKREYEASDKKEPIKFTSYWFFTPSFTYHQAKADANYMEKIKYHSQIDTVNVYDFYYTVQDEVPLLTSKYEVVKEWDYRQWVLLKRKK